MILVIRASGGGATFCRFDHDFVARVVVGSTGAYDDLRRRFDDVLRRRHEQGFSDKDVWMAWLSDSGKSMWVTFEVFLSCLSRVRCPGPSAAKREGRCWSLIGWDEADTVMLMMHAVDRDQ